MRLLFLIFSIVYIAGIFLFADSSLVSDLSAFNPYSLLHIPLYGILTVLLIFSFVPFKIKSVSKINPTNSIHLLAIAGLIAFFVAMADEIHQVYIPGRNASIADVLLDVLGIGLVIIIARRLTPNLYK